MAIARQQSTGEVTYAVAYFVPGERGVRVLSDLVDRGVRVKVLTNSLASTDVLAVHAGYAPYREGLLAGGVELYEYRPDASRPRPTSSLIGVGRSRSALHAKIVVYDRKLVWVGSANFDPRSRHLNTEAGMLVESAELAERLLASVEKDVHPTRSWSLARDVQEDGRSSLVWIGERDGQSLRLFSEPDAGWMRLLGVGVLSLVPGLEDLL
jgi:putative cardiolipin synthase